MKIHNKDIDNALANNVALFADGDELAPEVVQRIFYSQPPVRPTDSQLDMLTAQMAEKHWSHVNARIICSLCGANFPVQLTRSRIKTHRITPDIIGRIGPDYSMTERIMLQEYNRRTNNMVCCQRCHDACMAELHAELAESNADTVGWLMSHWDKSMDPWSEDWKSKDWRNRLYSFNYNQGVLWQFWYYPTDFSWKSPELLEIIRQDEIKRLNYQKTHQHFSGG